MRTAFVLLIALCSVADAGGRIVVMAGDDLSSALELALASHRVSVTTAPTPEGALRLERAAAAQHAAMASEAGASVWIDGGEVCVVSADGVSFRQAPLPPNTTPRVFAAIATSLLDELVAPPELVNVDVHVDIHPDVPGAPPLMSGLASATHADAATVGIVDRTALPFGSAAESRSRHAVVEVGPTLSPASFGMELELAVSVLPNVRVGALGGASHLFDGVRDIVANTRMYDGALEMRYIGHGLTHFDLGVLGGLMRGTLMDQTSDTGGFAALRLSYTREYTSSAVSFSVAPMVLFGFRGQGDDKNLGVMTSLRVALPI